LEYDKIGLKEFNEMKASFKKEKLEITKERQALLDSLTPEKIMYSKRLMTQFEKINSCKNKEELFNVLEEFSEYDDKCCTIHVNRWKDNFQRISQFKWISNPGPVGICNVVRIKTLETKDDNYLLWKYTEVNVSVDLDKKGNDFIDKWCAGIELHKPVVYSWDIPTDFAPDCQCIKYSW
jgi:hypothetical protein